jgi:hypothetical protein
LSSSWRPGSEGRTIIGWSFVEPHDHGPGAVAGVDLVAHLAVGLLGLVDGVDHVDDRVRTPVGARVGRHAAGVAGVVLDVVEEHEVVHERLAFVVVEVVVVRLVAVGDGRRADLAADGLGGDLLA